MSIIRKTIKSYSLIVIKISLVFIFLYQTARIMIITQTTQIIGDDKYLLIMREIAVTCIWSSVLLCVYFLAKRNLDEKQITFLCFILGLLFIFIITPLSPPDEQSHFTVSYLLSNRIMNLGVQSYEANQIDFDFTLLSPHNNTKNGYIWMIHGFNDPYINEENLTISDNMWTFKYFLEYLPQALGLTIARVFQANQVWTFFTGRFVNLIFYTFCVYVAVKTTPVYKTMLGITSLLPMALHQAGSYSSDSFINGIALIYFAFVIKLIMYEGVISKKDMMATVASIGLLSPAKVAYSPLVLLLFMVPKEKFKSQKQRCRLILSAFAICILMLCVFSVPILRKMIITSTDNTLSDNYSFDYILRHPLETISIFSVTLSLNVAEYWEQAIGKCLSGLSMCIPRWTIYAYTFLLLLSSIRVKSSINKLSIKVNMKLWLSVSVLLIVLMIMIMEFVGWTTYGSSYVEGIQGRYFIPVIPAICLLTTNNHLLLTKNIDKYLIAFSAFTTAEILVYVLDSTISNV